MSTRKIYSEVYAILSTFSVDYIERIPEELLTFIETKRDLIYTPTIAEDKPLNEQAVEKETVAFIAMLKLNYWCDSEKEKAEFLSILETNEEEFQKCLESATSTREFLQLIRNK